MNRKVNIAKKVLMLGLLCFFATGFYACDLITEQFDETGSEITERDNPRDPDSNDAIPPKAVIANYDASQVVTFDQHTFTVEWQPSTEGVTEGIEYRTRYVGPGNDIANKDWSNYSSATSLELAYLDESIEGGEFHFQVEARAQTQNGELLQESPTDFRFVIDVVPATGLFFNPRRITPDGSGIYTTDVWVDNVGSADSLAGIKAVISFDDEAYTFDNILVYEDSNSILSLSNGDIESFNNTATGRIEFNVGVLGGDVSNIQGSGKVARIQFRSSDGSTATVSLENTSKLKNINGGDISISAFDTAELSN